MLVALLGVLILKLAAGTQLGQHPLLAPAGNLDTGFYLQFAQRVAAGDVLLLDPASYQGQPPAAFFISPLYIYALALFLKVGGSIAAVRVLQLVLGTLAVWLMVLTARRWWGDRAGWAALVLATGCGLFTFYETLILQAALDPLLTALDLYLLTRAAQDGRPRSWAAAGAALGLHALNRPNMVIVLVGLAAAIFLRRPRHAAGAQASAHVAKRTPARQGRQLAGAGALLGAALLVITPVTARNYRASGDLVLISSHGGLNFLIGNGPDADGTFVATMGIEPSIRGQWLDAPRVASAAAGRELSAAETSSFFMTRAWEAIVSRPFEWPVLLARKAWYTVSGVFLTLNHSYPFFAHDAGTWLRFMPVGPLVLVPLGLLGLTLARPRARDAFLLQTFAALSFASVVVFFVAARYRLPLQVTLIVAAAGAVPWLIARVRSRDWRPLAGAAAIAGAAVTVVAWPTGLDDGRAEERARMGLYELEHGSLTAGEDWIVRAVSTHGFPGVVHLRSGQVHEAAGRLSGALTYYRLGLARDPDQAELRLAAGRVLIAQGQIDAGLGELALADNLLGTALAREYEKAGLALVTSGRLEDAIKALTRARSTDPKSPTIRLNLGVAYAAAGRMDDARWEAKEALKLDPTYDRARDFLQTIK